MSEHTTGPTPKTMAVWVLSAIIGLTFVGAAVAKFTFNVQLEKDILAFFGMLEGGWNPYMAVLARLVIICELALGLGMFQPYWRKRLILPLSLLMLAGFSVYLVTLPSDVRNCGCMGTWIEMTPRQSLVKNCVLMIAGCSLWWLLPKDPKGKFIIPFLLAVVSTTVVIGVSPVKPAVFGGIAKDFSHMTSFEGAKTDINDGISLLCFFSATCEHCMETADTLAGLKDPGVTVFYAFHGDPEDITRFRGDVGLESIPFCSVKTDDFFSNIGDAPPRVYLLKNGRAVAYWDGEVELSVIRNTIEKLK